MLERGLAEVESWRRCVCVYLGSKTEDTEQRSRRREWWCKLGARRFGPGFLSSTGFRLQPETHVAAGNDMSGAGCLFVWEERSVKAIIASLLLL